MALIEFYQYKEGSLTTYFLVMELCRPGSLSSMQKDVRFEEVHALYVMKEVTAGLEYLHM
jgi:serine/threonine protein kinase